MNKYPLKLRPVVKDIVWGGDLLKREYGKRSDSPRVAESWELTVRGDGMSVIDNGEYAGMKLCDYLGLEPDGEGMYDFPLIVKFIDARADLSVQVHPNKTEMWYIVEAEPDARLVYGLKKDFDEESFRAALAEKKLEPLLNYVQVKAGEYYMLPTGLIHAICGGILIAEIQQNSNITYRVWDYDRGREIHTEAAIEVLKARHENRDLRGVTECEYFHTEKLTIDGILAYDIGKSVAHMLCLNGEGQIGGESFGKGDSFYLPEGLGEVKIKGKATIIVTRA